ncbi:circularly permuted type 2 ATP-grasp protein [Metallosphaera javensis (ex Sakai et al. 2022)]|uniref:circularly permuted type 2 ATP-grasp protein n=1 Tax=Metallosphaera javensis (ex Sakai et al. 2022) TaxID=2775498 RepID=UPI00258CE48B
MKIRRMIKDRTYNEFLSDPINRKLLEKVTSLESKIHDLSRLVNLQAYMEGFTFYTSSRYRGTPIDVIPRVISSDFYLEVSNYLINRTLILNRLIKEVYQEKSVPIPDWIVKTTPFFKPEMVGFSPPKGMYVYVNGADIVRINGEPYILEDNVRVPSGIAYAYKAFEYVQRFLPDLSEGYAVKEPSGLEYLYETLRYASGSKDPVIALLTDGPLNSAYFEHRFISDRLGLVLAEPKDIGVKQGEVVVKTLDEGEVHVDVIYRRIEDLDVLTPELMKAYLRGWVTIANAPGVGIADDKATFVWIPYLAERYGISLEGVRQPITICLYERDNLQKVINNPASYVIKKREGYGGIGLSILKDDSVSVLKELMKEYENFIAQEVLDFDTVVSAVGDSFYETFADFRFFTYYDRVATAVLSRVGVVGSRVTNNSSGGMVKPVWITG